MASVFNISARDSNGNGIWFVGEDKTLKVSAKQADRVTAQAMTGWALTYDFMLSKGSAAAEFSKTVSSGIVLSNDKGTNDLATITIEDTDTEALATTGWVSGRKTFYHRLRRTDSGSEITLMDGIVELNENEGT